MKTCCAATLFALMLVSLGCKDDRATPPKDVSKISTVPVTPLNGPGKTNAPGGDAAK